MAFVGCMVVLGLARLETVDAKSNKVDIGHIDGRGSIRLISVNKAAVAAHVNNHGDFFPAEFFADADDEGFGDASDSSGMVCEVPPGFVDNGDDCDDSDAAIHPAAAEVYGDRVDNDCNPATPSPPICPDFSDSVESLT